MVNPDSILRCIRDRMVLFAFRFPITNRQRRITPLKSFLSNYDIEGKHLWLPLQYHPLKGSSDWLELPLEATNGKQTFYIYAKRNSRKYYISMSSGFNMNSKWNTHLLLRELFLFYYFASFWEKKFNICFIRYRLSDLCDLDKFCFMSINF